MTIKQIQRIFYTELAPIYPKTEIESFFYMLADAFWNLRRVDIALNHDNEVLINDKFHSALNDLIKQKPIQYILGHTEFFGMNFSVNEHVLIPRPETEELISWIIDDINTIQNKIKILDIGTGSGCIAISLAKNVPNAQVYALDISKDALQVAQQNANSNEVEVRFIEDDILNATFNIQSLDKFDIIVSNPPYVRELEKEEMSDNVLNNEPHLALFVQDENPLLFYDKIADFALKNLKKDGFLYFEINQYLSKETALLLDKKGFNVIEIKKDIFGVDRMIKASV
jgi:release factor glutamine methyltransferase